MNAPDRTTDDRRQRATEVLRHELDRACAEARIRGVSGETLVEYLVARTARLRSSLSFMDDGSPDGGASGAA